MSNINEQYYGQYLLTNCSIFHTIYVNIVRYCLQYYMLNCSKYSLILGAILKIKSFDIFQYCSTLYTVLIIILVIILYIIYINIVQYCLQCYMLNCTKYCSIFCAIMMIKSFDIFQYCSILYIVLIIILVILLYTIYVNIAGYCT